VRAQRRGSSCEARLSSSDACAIKTGDLEDYVYEPEPSVVKAELLNELAHAVAEKAMRYSIIGRDGKRTLLTSSKLIGSPSFKDAYKVVGRTEMDVNVIKEMLKVERAGKVVLRFDIEPERYWDVRKKLEMGLSGAGRCTCSGSE